MEQLPSSWRDTGGGAQWRRVLSEHLGITAAVGAAAQTPQWSLCGPGTGREPALKPREAAGETP